MLRAERHENFHVRRNAGMCSKNHRTSVAKVKKISVGVPYVLVREAKREEVGSLVEVERGIERRGDEAQTDVQAVHVKDWGGEGWETGVTVLESMDPACIASKNVIHRMRVESRSGKKACLAEDTGRVLDVKESVGRVQTVSHHLWMAWEERAGPRGTRIEQNHEGREVQQSRGPEGVDGVIDGPSCRNGGEDIP